MKRICTALFSILTLTTFAQISITGETTFRDATWGSYGDMEDVSGDDGGQLTFFVRNNGTAPDSVVDVLFSVDGTYHQPEAWQVWPQEMTAAGQGNNVCSVTLKGTDSPFAEGDTLTLEVHTSSGQVAYQSIQNTTPNLIIGNVIPTQDLQTLMIYLRNDDQAAYNIDELKINENSYTAGSAPELTAVGGSFSINTGEVKILKLAYQQPLVPLSPLAIRVKGTRQSDNAEVWVGAGIRVVEAEFPVGTWHSSGLDPEKEYGRKRLRKLHINSIHGPGNFALMDTAYREYFLQTVREPHFGDPFNPVVAEPEVQALSSAPYIHMWSCDDEPDLNGKPIDEQVAKNQTYWKNDPNTPSFVNLAVQRKFNRYGWYADIVSMDHYVAPQAPNIIQLTWVPVVGRPAEIEEALQYTEYLKFHSEPRRIQTWCQLAAGSSLWTQQPEDYTIDHQFWAHIMGGAKGIHWFVAQSDTEEDREEQWEEAEELIKKVSQVKGLCLYGESADVVSTNTSEVSSRALMGENYMVITVVNNNITFEWTGNLSDIKYETSIEPANYEIEFEVPNWVSMDQVYRVLEDGKESINLQNVSGNRYKIGPLEIEEESHVYVIGPNDNEAPGEPTGLNIPDMEDDANYTLSWKEPFDNFGVMGYLVKFNGDLVDTVRAPIFNVENGDFNCDGGTWEVIAYDAAGNLSSADTLSVPQSQTLGTASILSSPQNTTVDEWTPAIFTVEATGTVLSIQWQVSEDDGTTWTDLEEGFPYDGVENSDTLTIEGTNITMNGNLYRAIVAGCPPEVISGPAELTVIETNSVEELIANTQLHIHPNPSRGNFTLTVESTAEQLDDALIKIYNSEGILVDQLSIQSIRNSQSLKMDLSHLAKGIYQLNLQNEELVKSRLIIIQ